MNTLGEKIIEGRKKLGMSQEVFADKMGVTRQMVSRWELNESTPRMPKIKKISEVLEVSIDELLSDEKITPKEKSSELVVTKSFNYKKLIKRIAIGLLVVVALYLLYSVYKLIVLNVISSKVRQYQNVDNYYFKIENYIDGVKQNVREIWYKDERYKIVETMTTNDITSISTKYYNLKDGYMCKVNDNEKTYRKMKLYSTEFYDDGKYMYSLFPEILKKEVNNYVEYAFGPYLIFNSFKGDKISLTINNEMLEFNKDSLFPVFRSITMNENKIKYENYTYFYNTLNIVEDKDVTIPEEYILKD